MLLKILLLFASAVASAARFQGYAFHKDAHSIHSQQPLATQAVEKRVAVIGAGAAGSSTAYHVQKYADAAGILANITVFERNDYIGGRTTTVRAYNNADADSIELGGSIFVSVNYILQNATEEFGLNFSGTGDGSANPLETRSAAAAPVLGIWNGKDFVYRQSATINWWDNAKLIWRYGLSPVRTNNLQKRVIGTFLKMYEELWFPFQSLGETVQSLGLTAATATTGQQYLKLHGIGDAFARDIIQAATRVNYAQNLPLIHGLETLVSISTDGAVSIQGGNWQIFEKMARKATSDVRLEVKVTSVQQNKNGGYTVQSEPASDSASGCVPGLEDFDEVVIAAPFQFSGIDVDIGTGRLPDAIPYVELHVTLFTSPHLLSPAAFGLPPDAFVPEVILTTLQEDEDSGSDPHYAARAGFFSISLLQPIVNPNTSGQEFAYKIFSPAEATDEFVAKILGVEIESKPSGKGIDGNDVTWIYRKVWHSYPYEYPRVTFEELKLQDGLWYTGGMESFISTMETNALMGKNIARLMVNEWLDKT